MTTDRPMSEYEIALFAIVQVLAQLLLESGKLDETTFLEKLSEARENFAFVESRNAAATIAHLIKFLSEPLEYWVPGNLPKD